MGEDLDEQILDRLEAGLDARIGLENVHSKFSVVALNTTTGMLPADFGKAKVGGVLQPPTGP